jgi:hypothetical protein
VVIASGCFNICVTAAHPAYSERFTVSEPERRRRVVGGTDEVMMTEDEALEVAVRLETAIHSLREALTLVSPTEQEMHLHLLEALRLAIVARRRCVRFAPGLRDLGPDDNV